MSNKRETIATFLKGFTKGFIFCGTIAIILFIIFWLLH